MKRYKPTSPGVRHKVLVDNSHLFKGRPIKELTNGALKRKGGRNMHGRITVRHRGGGHKRLLRIIDFHRSVLDVPGEVMRVEYDPCRTAHLALIRYPDGQLQYILAPKDLDVGMNVIASRTQQVDIRPGNAMPIGMMPAGTIFHCMELRPGGGGQHARAAGTYAELLQKNYRGKFALVRNCSKEERLVHPDCLGTIGQLSNPLHKFEKHGKAGRRRWLGFRPHVRGTAMNPIDHPHGGGHGKDKGGQPSVTPWGKPTKGYKTRAKNKWNPHIVMLRGGKILSKEARYYAALEMKSSLQKQKGSKAVEAASTETSSSADSTPQSASAASV